MLRILTFIVFFIGLASGVFIFFPELQEGLRGSSNEPNAEPKIVFTEEKEPVITEENLNLSLEEFINKGDDLARGGFLTLAANNYSAALSLEPKNKTAYLKLIETYIALRDFTSAKISCEKALEKLGDDHELLLILGEIFIQSSEFTRAQVVFSKLPDTIPEKFFYLGALNAFNSNHDEAQKNLNIAKNSKLKSQSEVILGAYSEFALFPKSSELHLKLLIAKAFNQLKLYEMAVQSSKEIIKENEKYRDAWLILGHSYLSLEKFDFAQKAFLKALALDSTKAETSFFLGIAEAELENYEEAIDYMDNALLNGYEPKIDTLRKLGDFNLQAENYSLAVRYYEEALHLANDSVDSFVRPVWILIDYMDNAAKAEEIARWAIEKHPNSAMSYNLLAWSQIAATDFKNAEISLKRALTIDPDFAAAHLNFGDLYEQQNKVEKALESYKKAYELDPNSSIGASAAHKFNLLIERYQD